MAALVAAAARAQEAATTTVTMEAPPTLNLDDAIRMALQRNKNLKVSGYGPGISRANLLVAYGAFDPAIIAQPDRYSSTHFNTSIGPSRSLI